VLSYERESRLAGWAPSGRIRLSRDRSPYVHVPRSTAYWPDGMPSCTTRRAAIADARIRRGHTTPITRIALICRTGFVDRAIGRETDLSR